MAADPFSQIALMQLAMNDPEKFGEIMASSGAPPPEPKKVKTTTIKPEKSTPAQRIGQGFGDIKGEVEQTRRPDPGESLAQVLQNPSLIAGGAGTNEGGLSLSEIVEPKGPPRHSGEMPLPVADANIFDPTPVVDQPTNMVTTPPANNQVTTGTFADRLARAFSGVRMPEQPQSSPMAAPNIPNVDIPSVPSAPAPNAPPAPNMPAVNLPSAPGGGRGGAQTSALIELLLGGRNPLMMKGR